MLLVVAQSKVRLMVSIDFTLSSNSVFELHKKFVFSPAKDVTFLLSLFSMFMIQNKARQPHICSVRDRGVKVYAFLPL